MKRLAVIPSDPIEAYLKAGYNRNWLEDYYNPCKFFDEVYLLSPHERGNPDLLGMKVIGTRPDELKKRLRDLNVDIVRAYGGYWACDMACDNKVNGVPVVVSVHDTRPELLYKSIRKADVIFCVSEGVRKLVLTKFRNSERVWILPNRINFSVMRPYSKDELGDLSDKYPFKYRILHVGRKTAQKNPETLIKALKTLGDEYCLLAVGRGDEEKYVELAEELGVSKQCYFIQSIKNEELARYYSWVDCMCTPSRWEGFGIVFIEALACEAIVVTSDIAPMNEYIKNMINGLLVKDYENPQALAQMIKLACTNGKVRESLKRNARKSVEDFEKSRVDELEVDYYKKTLLMGQKKRFNIPFWKKYF
jgi:glycosyltransferase involved in cell wall biosynthesis